MALFWMKQHREAAGAGGSHSNGKVSVKRGSEGHFSLCGRLSRLSCHSCAFDINVHLVDVHLELICQMSAVHVSGQYFELEFQPVEHLELSSLNTRCLRHQGWVVVTHFLDYMKSKDI